jgi:hypothetical protein
MVVTASSSSVCAHQKVVVIEDGLLGKTDWLQFPVDSPLSSPTPS